MLVGVVEGARRWGVHHKTVSAWMDKGVIPFVMRGERRMIDVEVADGIVAARAEAAARAALEPRRCYVCGIAKPDDAFVMIRGTYGKAGQRVPSFDCRECRNEQRRQWRARKAAEAGKRYRTADEVAAERDARVAHARADKERRAAERAAARAARPRRTHKEVVRRVVARQRERCNSDPEYQARIKATKIKRKRAMRGSQVVPVNREVVAERDGWRCAICRKRVTRSTWSLDHIVPLSKGGSHTYANVTLAHRSCNCRRGAGRLPVQAPLFPVMDGGA